MSGPEILPSGQRALLVEVGDAAAAHAFATALRAVADSRVQDVVPGARTVLVVAREAGQLAAVTELVGRVRPDAGDASVAAEVVLEVDYDGEDLAEVAQLTGLSVDEVVHRHSGASYVVDFVGFAPGFGYLRGLDPALLLPRLSTPRPQVPAGSVAIAGPYAAVYPRSSPGGWRLLGRTETVLFDVEADPPSRLQAGTRVRFVPR